MKPCGRVTAQLAASMTGPPTEVLICGLGSIGQRHLRHFSALGCTTTAYRTGHGTLRDDPKVSPAVVYDDLTLALESTAELVVVANPSHLHAQTCKQAIQAGKHVLVEKPLSSSLTEAREVEALALANAVEVRVAQNLRFHPLLVALRDWLLSDRLGQPILARAHCGSYLPDWHPWEDYRRSYAFRKEMGGGAALTNIHELDAILWLLGPFVQHSRLDASIQPLGSDVDEATILSIVHQSGAISSVSLSLAEKPANRTLFISGTCGSTHLDVVRGVLRWEPPGGHGEVLTIESDFTFDRTYRDQAKAMLNVVAGGQEERLATVKEAVCALEVVLS